MSKQQLTNSQLLDLVEQALTLPPAERYAWLEANGAPEVYADARRLLDLASSATGQTWSNPQALPSTVSHAGRQIGAYVVERLLGEGGMGQVYLAARNDGQFEQTVAIKVVRVQGMQSALTQQFEIERQILANLKHPNIATLLDGGTTDDGLHYVVMEYVDGASLTEYLRAATPSVNDTLRLFVKICRAVESAHRALVIHRDIKPGNILVTTAGEPKLLDFGIAKMLPAGQQATDAKQTILGALTPAYASPEQVRGEPLTTASDVYALGVVLYEALTGVRPHDTAGLSPAETERALTEAVTRPASERVDGNVGRAASLRGDVDAILLKALAPETTRRYGAAGALADDIERYLRSEPVTAQRDSSWYRLRKLMARNRAATVAAGVTMLAVLGGLFVSLWQAGVAREQRELAVAQLGRAEAVSEFLGDILLSPSANWDSDLQTGTNATISDVLDVAEEKLQADLQDQPEVRVELLSQISEARLWMDQPERAENTIRAAIDVAQTELAADSPLQVEARYRLGAALAEVGRHQDAIVIYEEAMETARTQGTEGNLTWLYILNDRAISHSELGESDQSLVMQSAAVEGMHALFGDEVLPAWGIGYNNLAYFQYMEADFEAAESSFKKSLQGYEAFPEQNLLTGVSALNNLGEMYSLQGRIDESMAMHRRAVELVERLVEIGVGDNDYATGASRLAARLCVSGDTVAGRDQLETVKTRLSEHLDKEEAWVVYDAVARCAVVDGDFDSAVAAAERALEMSRLGEVHVSGWAGRLVTLALAHSGAGNSTQAHAAASQSLAAYRDWLGDDHPVTQRVKNTLGTVEGF